MRGVDRRDPTMTVVQPGLLIGEAPAEGLAAQCMRSRQRAIGWIYHTVRFGAIDPAGDPTVDALTLRVPDMTDGAYHVEFWDTVVGKPVARVRTAAKSGILAVKVPPFARDIAFKARRDISGR